MPVIFEKFESEALKSNPLNDPFLREVAIYLPPSYDRSADRYSVIYCLSGFAGASRSWFNFQPWQPRIDERIDKLIVSGMAETIFVFPDCFTRYGGSQYLDSIAVGSYRTYLLQEIIPFIDKSFRTNDDAEHRAIVGKSSGGYGAITIGMDHPELFSALACHSGDMYFEHIYLPDFAVAARQLEKLGGLARYLEDFDQMPKTGKEDHALINTIAMSACYSPDPAAIPHLFDLPFEEYTARLKPEVWKRWKEKDPVQLIDQKAENLRKLKMIFFDAGNRDEFFLNFGSRLLRTELMSRNIPHEYQEFEGGHFQTSFRYEVSFPKLADAIR